MAAVSLLCVQTLCLQAGNPQPNDYVYHVLAPFNQQYEPGQLGEILSWVDCGLAVSAVTLHRGRLVVPLSFDFGGGEGNGAMAVYDIDDPRKPVSVFDSRDFPKQYHAEGERDYLGDIGEIHGLYFYGDKVLLQEKGHDRAGFCILDLGPLFDDDLDTRPRVVCRYSFPGVERSTIYDGFSFSPAWVGGKYAYCPTGSSGLYIVDTENLDEPKLLSHLTKEQLYNQPVRAVNPIGDMLVLSPAVVATEEEDIVFLDVSDPSQPGLINRHRIKLGYLGIVYGSRFYNGAYSADR